MIGKFLGLLAFWPVFALAETTTVSAQNSTEYCASSVFIGIQIKNNSHFPALKCSDLQPRFEKAFQAVRDVSPVPLTAPMLVVYNQELSRGSTYSWIQSTMTVDLGDLSKIEQQIDVFYHEMGHKIYFEYIAHMIPEVAAKKVFIDRYASYMKICAVSATPDASCATSDAPENLSQAIATFSKNFNQFYSMATPLNELFADVVASLASGKRDAIADALGPCTSSNPACEYRAFSKNTIDMFSGTNPYSRFSPIRKDLWDSAIAPHLNDKPAVLNQLATVFLIDTIAFFKEDAEKVEGMQVIVSTKRLNNRLGLQHAESATLLFAKY